MLKDRSRTAERRAEDADDRRKNAVLTADTSRDDMPDDKLSSLIEKARSGDNDAFSLLVEEYERFVYNTACRVLSASGASYESAEDIAQIAFVKAWRNLSAFRGDCSFSTWLFRITVNTARDSLRTAARRSSVSLTKFTDDDADAGDEWDVPVTSGDEVPEDSLLKKEQIIGIRRAIEALPEEQRQVVVMRDIHELSYQTIADTLGLELGTVKSRLNRGRANLKILLEKGNFI